MFSSFLSARAGQEKQIETIEEAQQKQLQAIEDQTKTIKSLTQPTTSVEEELPLESPRKPIDPPISDSFTILKQKKGPLTNFIFSKTDLNNYEIKAQEVKRGIVQPLQVSRYH